MKIANILFILLFLTIPVLPDIYNSKSCKDSYEKTRDLTLLIGFEEISEAGNQEKLYTLYSKNTKYIMKLINNNCFIENTHIPIYLKKKNRILEKKHSNEKYNKHIKENIEKFKLLAIKIFDIEREIENIGFEGIIDLAKETKSNNYNISDLLLSVASMSIKKDRMNTLIEKHNNIASDANFIYVLKMM